MSSKTIISMTVNQEPVEELAEPRMLLSDFLRETLGLTGTHVGCEHGICGACTVQVNGVTTRSCLMFAIQAEGAEVKTVESFGTTAELHKIQEAFRKHHALQCGYCTPGFLLTVQELLETWPLKTDDEIRDGLSGNICRCTGYDHIVKAVRELVNDRDGGAI